jgi:hypothetical protein
VLASGIEHWSTVQAQLAPRQVPSVELASLPVMQRLLLRQKPHSGAAAHASQPESAAHGSGVVASRTALSIVVLASGVVVFTSGVAVTSRDTVTSGVLASGVVGGLQATAPNSAPAIHGVRRARHRALGWTVEVVMKIDGPFAQGVVFALRDDRGVQRECQRVSRVNR